MVADLGTKPLPGSGMEYLKDLMGMWVAGTGGDPTKLDTNDVPEQGAVTALRLITIAAVIQAGAAYDHAAEAGVDSETEGDVEFSALVLAYTIAVVGITLLVTWGFGWLRLSAHRKVRPKKEVLEVQCPAEQCAWEELDRPESDHGPGSASSAKDSTPESSELEEMMEEPSFQVTKYHVDDTCWGLQHARKVLHSPWCTTCCWPVDAESEDPPVYARCPGGVAHLSHRCPYARDTRRWEKCLICG